MESEHDEEARIDSQFVDASNFPIDLTIEMNETGDVLNTAVIETTKEEIDVSINLSEPVAATASPGPELPQDPISKHVQFVPKKPSVNPITPNFAISDLYEDLTQEINLSSTDQIASQILGETTDGDADLSNRNLDILNDTTSSQTGENPIDDTLTEDIHEITSGIVEIPQDKLPSQINTWISGIRQMAEFPAMNALQKELIMTLKTQIKAKKFDLPFTMPFDLNDIKRKMIMVGRQQVASTPKKAEERLKLLLEADKKRQIREQSIYIEPHMLYRKMPKPKEGFVIYGACFGQPKK